MGCSGCGKSKKEFKEMVDSQVKLGAEETKEQKQEREKNELIEDLESNIKYLKSVKRGDYLERLLEKDIAILEKMQPKEPQNKESK